MLPCTDGAAVVDVDPDESSMGLVVIEPNRVAKIRFKLGICYQYASIE